MAAHLLDSRLYDRLAKLLVRLAKKLLAHAPGLISRILDMAFNPKGHLRQLALVVGVQVCSFLLQRLRAQLRRGIIFENQLVRKQEAAKTYRDWLACDRRIEEMEARAANIGFDRPLLEQCTAQNREFFAQLQQRADNYEALQRAGDEFGLMFHLRSELMRKQAGGAGYSRDGSTWLRKHAAARERIHSYQESVKSALRYVASGVAPGSSRAGHRLAFINETRHAFGRTALLLSGGAAFGVKHLGVVSALYKCVATRPPSVPTRRLPRRPPAAPAHVSAHLRPSRPISAHLGPSRPISAPLPPPRPVLAGRDQSTMRADAPPAPPHRPSTYVRQRLAHIHIHIHTRCSQGGAAASHRLRHLGRLDRGGGCLLAIWR